MITITYYCFALFILLVKYNNEPVVQDLRRALESAYQEIGELERSDVSSVQDRFEKVRLLQDQVLALETQISSLGSVEEERLSLNSEFERLTGALGTVTEELVNITVEKTRLEETLKGLENNQSNPETEERLAELELKVQELLENLEKSEQKTSNLELSNQSLMETMDDLVR